MLEHLFLSAGGSMWWSFIFLGIFLGFVASLVGYYFCHRLLPVYERKEYRWHIVLAKSFHTPLQVFIWLMVIYYLVFLVISHYKFNEMQDPLSIVKGFLIAIFLFWFSMRFIKNVEAQFHHHALTGKSRIKDRTQISAFCQILRVVVFILFLLVLLPILGIPMAALLTFGGASTIVIGFATKDTLANFLGGLMIYWDRPFSVGDWISSPDKQIEGTVEDIGWRLTRIRTFDKRPLYVPNGFFSTISILNPSRMTNRRIKKTIGVRFSDAAQIPSMLSGIENMLRNHPEIDTNQTLMVNLFEFGDSSMNFFIYTFTKTTNWVKFEAIQQDVLLKTYEIIQEHGADCAFPTQTLDLPTDFFRDSLGAQQSAGN